MFLEIKNTTIGYKTPLIKGVETSLDLGEICLLIGNNGVGKTTLLKSILNQIPLLEGDIVLNGKKIKTLSNKEIAEQIAVVFSKSSIPANYTLTDLISLGKYIHYPYYFDLKTSDKNHVEEIIESLNLTQYKNFPLQKLSDGNLQKAFIGRAIAQNSPVIILDEPTTHLDEENKIIILKLLRNLAKNHHKLILFSSHDWRLAKEFSDKIWYSKNQKLHNGITEEILQQNQELTQSKLFNFHPQFVGPKILAPNLEKEMLFSFLQKNFNKNLTNISFEFKNGDWMIKKDSKSVILKNYSQILKFIQNTD